MKMNWKSWPGLLLFSSCFLPGIAAWTGGRLRPGTTWLLLVSGLLILLCLWKARRQVAEPRMRNDPFLWIGLAFLLFLGVQATNTGRILYLNPVTKLWSYTAPPLSFLPWAFSRQEALQMLGWFFPAWALALALRHAPDRCRLGRTLVYFIVINGILLAFSGLTQWIYYSGDLRRSFYATFGYRNHASAFFVLALAGTLGLLRYQIGWRRGAAEPVYAPIVLGLGAGAVLLAVALHTALCRAGMMFSWALLLLFLGSLIFGKDSTRGLIRRIQTGVAVAMILGIAIAWVIIPDGTALKRIEKMDSSGWTGQVEGRFWQWDAAWRIWKDNKIWGTGGWGYAHLLPLYADEFYVKDGQVSEPGRANVHNDLLQFLAEFGLAGVSLLLGAWGVLLARFIRGWRTVRGRPVAAIYLFGITGLAMVCLHSLIDLPFRNPAVLYAWIILLVAVPAGWRDDSITGEFGRRDGSRFQEWLDTPVSFATRSLRRRRRDTRRDLKGRTYFT